MNILDLLKMVKNPSQLENVALKAIRKNNPQMADILSGCIQRGESPEQILSEAIQAGTVTKAQFDSFRSAVEMYSAFIPGGISTSQLDAMERQFGKGSFRF